MSPELVLLFILLGLLNAGLALLVLRTQRERTERALLASLFGSNAILAFLDPLPHGTPYVLLDGLTIALLMAIPAAWVAPRRPRLARALYGLAAASMIFHVIGIVTPVPMDWPLTFTLPAAVLTGLVVFSREARKSDEARYFLAAYVLAAASFLPFPGRSIPFLPPVDATTWMADALMVAVTVAFGYALFVATLGLFRSERPLTYAPVLAAIPVAGIFFALGYPSFLYLLMRPMLLAYGFLFARLPGGPEQHRALVLAPLAAAVVASFLTPAVIVTGAGGSLLFGTSLGLVGLAAVVGLFARPLAITLLAQPTLAPERFEPEPGATVLGRYHIIRALGRGATATAHLAEDTRLRRLVVLKVAPAGPALLREARAIAKIDHPNVVRVLDVQTSGDKAILVLEHVEGESLEAWRSRGRGDPVRIARLADDVLAALECAHAAGVIHRDVKPANVLVGNDGRARLVDFGIASAEGLDATGFSWEPAMSAGTPRYMSPEQVRGKDVDARTDLFSLGAILFELLSGAPAAEAATRNGYDLRVAIVQDPPALPVAGVPAGWNDLLARLLAKERADRPASASEARAMLRAAALV